LRLLPLLRSALIGTILLAAGLHGVQAADTPGAYTFRSFGPEQGLRNQAVTGLAQDNDGFLFVGTEDGLFRYDGHRFQRFASEHGLASDSITTLYSEPGGRLWVLSVKGAVAWAGNGVDKSVPTLLPGMRVESMAAATDGRLLVSTGDGIYEGTAGKLALAPGLPRGEAGAAWLSPDGKRALVTSQGTLYSRSGNGAWQARPLPEGYKNEPINGLLEDREGRIWIRGRRVLLRLAGFDGAAEDLSSALPGASVTRGQLVADAKGRVWVPTNVGLVCFDGKEVRVRISEAQGLPSQWIASILFDREGNLWLASEGVLRLQGRMAWSAHTRRQKLPSDTVWSVTRSADGVLWAGTNRGLARATATGWQVLPETQDRSVYAFAHDAAGNMWVGGNNAVGAGNHLMLRRHGGDTFTSVPLTGIDGPSTINSMDVGPDGALYVGTQTHGLRRIAADGAQWTGSALTLPGGQPGEQINQVLHEGTTRLWVTAIGGLARLDATGWRRFGKADGLLEDHVETMAIDRNGEVWISYWNKHGLSHFHPGANGLGKVTHVDRPAALVADNIYSMGFDARGALWLGTAQGAKRWQDGRLDRFGRGEGLPSDDSAANAFWPDRNGDVWIGMASGLAHFEAAAEPAPAPPPAARVMQLRDGNGKVLTESAPEVAWANRALTFDFAVPSFVNEARVQTQVRLAGFEDDWRDTDIREARYTGLPPGNFRFEVRASMGDERWGPVSRRDVVIAAPWWRTGWAIAGMVLLLATLVLLFVRWRLGYLHRRNTELEALVRARTDALEQANDALREASMVDPLTGLKNRRFLGLSMPDELARVSRQYRAAGNERSANNKTLLFFMIDIDHFKSINDTYGHATGDLVLQHCSAALRRACRDADFVVRWGGEEFLIVARNSDRSYAEKLANNLRDAVRKLQIDTGNGVILQKTCSIGFAAFPAVESAPGAHPWEDVVKMADQCLYAAKLSGRDTWVGLVMPDDAVDPGPRMGTDLGPLVAEGRVRILSSLPQGAPLRWQ